MDTFMITADNVIVGKIRAGKFEHVIQSLPVIAPDWDKLEIFQFDTEAKAWNYTLGMTKDIDTELDPHNKVLRDRQENVTEVAKVG